MRTIKRCVNNRIVDLCSRVMKLEMLDVKIRSFLPAELKNICKAGSFENGCLTLMTSDAVWATPLNYLKPELRDFLRKEAGLRQLSSIIIKIDSPAIQVSNKPKKSARTLPVSSRESILELAESCEIPQLKQALIKLAR